MDGYNTKLCISVLSFVIASEMREHYMHKVVQSSFSMNKDVRKSFNNELTEAISLKVSTAARPSFISVLRSLRVNYEISDYISNYTEELVFWHFILMQNREYILSRIDRIKKDRPNINVKMQLVDYVIKTYHNNMWLTKQVSDRVMFSYETAITRLLEKGTITSSQYDDLLSILNSYLTIKYYSPSLEIQ